MAKRKPSLEDCRKKIDSIDKKIVELLDDRAVQARRIGEIKAEQGLDFYDPGRQRRVLQKVVSSGGNEFTRNGLKVVFTEIMSNCLSLERQIRVAFFGSESTFTHQAALSVFGNAAEYIPMPDGPSLFNAIEKDQADYSVVPIENTTGGVNHGTLDLFLDYGVSVCNEIIMPISMTLLSNNKTLEKIETVYSHPQAFLQCQVWLARNLPKAQRVEVASTVEGIQRALKDRRSAALGSELATRNYKIKALSKSIEDHKDNATRFWVLSHRNAEPSGDDKTSMMFSVKHRAGALIHILDHFAKRKINLTKIESRPSKRKGWEYILFIDLLGHITDRKLQNAIAAIKPMTNYLKILGSYPQSVDTKS